jgi:hypothetical protein
MNQGLLERYIHAVKILLPLNKSDDIAAEIRSNLLSVIEDQEAEVGRELNSGELSGILKQNGHPMLVASRYVDPPKRSLIGPALFPFYWFTLRAVLLLVFAIILIVAAFQFVKSPDLVEALLHLWTNLWLGAISVIGWVTVSFAIWEYCLVKFRFPESWNPQSLPAVPRAIRAPQPWQPSPVVQIAIAGTWLVWWGMVLYFPRVIFWGWPRPGVFDLSPAWAAMRPLLWLLVAIGIAQSSMKFTRFASAEWLKLFRVGFNIVGLAFFILYFRAGDLLVPGAHWDPVRYGYSLAFVNRIVEVGLVLACIILALSCLYELRNFMRRRKDPLLSA